MKKHKFNVHTDNNYRKRSISSCVTTPYCKNFVAADAALPPRLSKHRGRKRNAAFATFKMAALESLKLKFLIINLTFLIPF